MANVRFDLGKMIIPNKNNGYDRVPYRIIYRHARFHVNGSLAPMLPIPGSAIFYSVMNGLFGKDPELIYAVDSKYTDDRVYIELGVEFNSEMKFAKTIATECDPKLIVIGCNKVSFICNNDEWFNLKPRLDYSEIEYIDKTIIMDDNGVYKNYYEW